MTKTEASEAGETPSQENPSQVDWNVGVPVYRFFYERMVRAEIQILKSGEISLFDKANKLDWIAYLGFTGTVAAGSTIWWQRDNIGQAISDFVVPIWVWTADKFYHLTAQPELLQQILPIVGGG